MSKSFIPTIRLPEFPLWEKARRKKGFLSFDLELTARCNNNCRHCYINLPVQNKEAKNNELAIDKIKQITDEAVSLDALWCLITGGEPLLREDFFDIYMYLKKKGLLVSVFTNATLITKKHLQFFKKYPPRDIEVTVYGVTKETYENVTRKRGSFNAFMHGLILLLDNGLKVRLKAMALRSNVHELPQISRFCKERTKDLFRFDALLQLRFDRDTKRNEEIKSERLSAQEIVAIEQADPERFQAMEKYCKRLDNSTYSQRDGNHLFSCGVGFGDFTISYDGFFHLCSSLRHPGCSYDLKKGTLAEVCHRFIPQVISMSSNREDFLRKCRRCSLIHLCMWCPAHSYLETGELDSPVEYFCEVAHVRAEALGKSGEFKRIK